MKQALDFIKGSISTSNLDARNKYICSYSSRIQAFNGVTYADHPLEGVDDFICDGKNLINACKICSWKQSLKVTDVNVLVKHGNTSIRLPLTPEFNVYKPKTGLEKPLPDDFLNVLKALQPFMSRDATRNWSISVLVKDGVACATNNVSIVFKNVDAPDMLIPADMVDLLISIGECPVSVDTDNGILFYYNNTSYVYCTGLSAEYPDLSQLLQMESTKELTVDVVKDLNKLGEFDKEGVVAYKDGKMFNGDASIEGHKLEDFAFYYPPLLEVLKIATHMDFGTNPTPFKGNGVRGVLVGVQL